ncbi:hypothetical protein COCON_G00230280 [Conger conger]|uniref:Uncharacterized protein n=1 Tax=Conger conger TaxID=82655 RepID=A0A9Q1HM42_CONCO|nr:hypothetical protein COCON_G00230280 [Conger conger]
MHEGSTGRLADELTMRRRSRKSPDGGAIYQGGWTRRFPFTHSTHDSALRDHLSPALRNRLSPTLGDHQHCSALK